MNDLVKVAGTKFVRDTNNMALINQDATGLNDYMNKRRMMEQKEREINNIKSELTNLKEDMKDIKDILIKLLDKNTHG